MVMTLPGLRALKPLNDWGISGGMPELPESSSEVFVELGIPVSEAGGVDFDVLSWVGSVLPGACEDACAVVAVADGSAVCWLFLPRNHQAPKARAMTRTPTSATIRPVWFFFGGCWGAP